MIIYICQDSSKYTLEAGAFSSYVNCSLIKLMADTQCNKYVYKTKVKGYIYVV